MKDNRRADLLLRPVNSFALIWLVQLLAAAVNCEILNSSKCEVQSEAVTCVCVGEGFLLPNITWPTLKNSTTYTVTISVSDQLVTSTMTVSLKDPNITTIRCVNRFNENKTTDAPNITISQNSSNTNLPDVLQRLKEILDRPLLFLIVLGTGVLIGMLLSAVVVCLAVKCHRKKSSRNLDEGLEMVTTETVSKKVEDGIQDHEAGGGNETADSNEAPKETVYSDINFSAMKAKSQDDLNKEDTPETEYAEIKKGEMDGGNGEAVEGDDDEVEDEEAEQSLLVEEGVGEDVPLYSTVDEAMDEN